MSKLRQYVKTPIFIVEHHCDVLEPLSRALGRRYIPFLNNVLIHFDSHPDLGVSQDLRNETLMCENNIRDNVDIESWITPWMYIGHWTNVVWIRPPWADQLDEGQYDVTLGWDRETKGMRISLDQEYFVMEGVFNSKNKLESAKSSSLSVVTLAVSNIPQKTVNNDSLPLMTPPSDGENLETFLIPKDLSVSGSDISIPARLKPLVASLKSAVSKAPMTPSGNPIYVLDMDLDFFSVLDPFVGLLPANLSSFVQRIYSDIPNSSSVVERATLVRDRMKMLENVFGDLKDRSDLFLLEDIITEVKAILQKYRDTRGFEFIMEMVLALINHWRAGKTVCSNGMDVCMSDEEKSSWSLFCMNVHSLGITRNDGSSLPHHVSSMSFIAGMLQDFYLVFSNLPKPTIITVARSALDGYCPLNQVDDIQNGFVGVCSAIWGQNNLEISHLYKSES